MNQNKNILFEKFEIIECLKKDDHTGVYLADHIYLGKKIILKSMNTKTIGDSSRIERFKREAKILAKLDNPNIIKVLDFGTYQEYFFISFEYFDSQNLREVINNKNLSEDDKLKLVEQLIKGLNFAHSFSIIHRDIKPENILVDESLTLKISDFGLALSENDNFVTNQYSIVGTPCYMSPEQIQGEKLDQKSDFFSLGILIYEIYTGENPFIGSDVNKTISNIINYRESELFPNIEKLPEPIPAILKRLLIKDSDRRVASLLEFSSLLNIDAPKKVQKKSKNLTFSIAVSIVILISMFMYYYPFTKEESLIDEGKDLIVRESNPILVDSITTNDNKDTAIEKKEEEPVQQLIVESDNIVSEPEIEKVEKEILYGTLNIKCFPWAEVIISGENKGITPLGKINLAEGNHEIELKHPEYPSLKKNIYITALKDNSIQFNLDTLFGYFNCNVHPWGDLYINNEYKGQTPLNRSIILVPGKYDIEIKNPNYKNFKEEISISKKDTLIINHNFESEKDS